MNREKLVDALNAAMTDLGGSRPVEGSLRQASRHLEKIADKAGGALDGALAALDRAAIEVSEAMAALQAAGGEVDADSARLQDLDDRLFALRDAARKHRVTVDQLPRIRADFAARLAGIEDQSGELERLRAAVSETRNVYTGRAEALFAKRKTAAAALDEAVELELPPLKLDRAHFVTRVEALPEADWGADGMDRVAFEVATNPGAAPGPLGKIASGGELSRFMLAIKVCCPGPARYRHWSSTKSTAASAGDRPCGGRTAGSAWR